MEDEKLSILEQFLGFYYKTGQEYLFKCPKCNHYKNKLSVNISRNVFKCWICEYSGNSISPLVKRYGGHSLYQQWGESGEKIDLSSFEQLFSVKEEEQQILTLPEEFVSLSSKINKPFMRHAMSYLKSRNIDQKCVLRWKIGCFSGGKYFQRVCVPSFSEEGDLNYFVTRSYAGDYMKYKNPDASKDIIFNDLYIDWSKPVVLVEGVFDAFRCENSIPILGSTLKEGSKLFQKIVRNNSTVYLALDSDAKLKQLQLAKKLLQYGITVYNVDTSSHKDVGDMSSEQFLAKKKEASIVDMTDYLYQNLNF
ncbi:MAG: hypothetical protein CBD26_03470 [Candidatus Pelagibacter sp. TMED166]|nr:MAG: hypothetical protein CBD26_03470 [Candidatus Pelagibacter sp. TMED166]